MNRPVFIFLVLLLWSANKLIAVSFCENSRQDAEVASLTTAQVSALQDYTFKLSELPAWFRIYQSQTDSLHLLLGISDPGLPDSIARLQALSRLKLMAALTHEVQLNFNTELFNRILESNPAGGHLSRHSKFVRFNRFTSTMDFHPEALHILDSTTNTYGEKIMLAIYEPPAHSEKPADQAECIEIDIDFMAIEFSKGHVFSTDQFLKMQATIDGFPLSYTLYKAGEIAEIHAMLGENELAFNFNYYKYLLSENTEPAEGAVSARLYYGLWKAYFEAFCRSLSDFHHNGMVKQRFVQDTYQEMIMNLSQERSMIQLKSRITELDVFENELHLQLDLTVIEE